MFQDLDVHWQLLQTPWRRCPNQVGHRTDSPCPERLANLKTEGYRDGMTESSKQDILILALNHLEGIPGT